MEVHGQNAIYEDIFGNIEIVGPTGHTIFVPADERRGLAKAISIQRNKVWCMGCGNPIPSGFECPECHKKYEQASEPVYIWQILRNGEIHKMGKDNESMIYKRFEDMARNAHFTDWDMETRCYRDNKGNWLALQILGQVQLAPEPIRVDPVFAD